MVELHLMFVVLLLNLELFVLRMELCQLILLLLLLILFELHLIVLLPLQRMANKHLCLDRLIV